MEKLREYQYVDDRAYAAEYVRTNGTRYGAVRLRSALRLKGIDRETIDAALNGAEEELDFAAAALAAAEKYAGTAERTPALKAKLYRRLYVKGFDRDDIDSALRQIFD
jgi:SOS response regulatory protein OraA/RecX